MAGSLAAAEPATPAPVNKYTGVHLGLVGGYGLSNPNASFSTFLPGTQQDYRSASEFGASLAYYWNDENALVLRVATAQRDLAFKDSTASGLYPMQFMDIRGGYRLQPSIVFVEFGILGAIKTKDVPLTIATSSSSASGSLIGIDQKSYVAIYVMMGLNVPVSQNLFLEVAGKIDYGITPAVEGNWPYYTASNVQYKTEKISLVPFNVGATLGLGFRF